MKLFSLIKKKNIGDHAVIFVVEKCDNVDISVLTWAKKSDEKNSLGTLQTKNYDREKNLVFQ